MKLTIMMKKKQLIIMGMAVLMLASCGPRRYSCGGRKRCISALEQEQKQQAPLQKQETPKRNA